MVKFLWSLLPRPKHCAENELQKQSGPELMEPLCVIPLSRPFY